MGLEEGWKRKGEEEKRETVDEADRVMNEGLHKKDDVERARQMEEVEEHPIVVAICCVEVSYVQTQKDKEEMEEAAKMPLPDYDSNDDS